MDADGADAAVAGDAVNVNVPPAAGCRSCGGGGSGSTGQSRLGDDNKPTALAAACHLTGRHRVFREGLPMPPLVIPRDGKRSSSAATPTSCCSCFRLGLPLPPQLPLAQLGQIPVDSAELRPE